ncbi:MAG: hypothetical protein AMXMBFR64_51970 [Myxococcales bacterium]
MGTVKQRVVLGVLVVVLAAALWWRLRPGGAHDAPHGEEPPPIAATLEVVASGLKQPLGVIALPRDPAERLLVVEKGGLVRVLGAGGPEPAPWLDVSDRISRGGEQGLLGLALHPRWPDDPRVYISYTDAEGGSRVEELRGPGSSPPDPAPARTLLALPQPYANHNGGHITFGPDGALWLGLGDGGSGGDPHGNGQNPATLLGALVSFDVDGDPRPRVRVHGLRNPWRFAFGPGGDLYIADVGQNAWEEVTVLPAHGIDGANLGWNVMEGAHCFGDRACDPAPYVAPAVEYGHDAGCSVTGGLVIRDPALPALAGAYIYGDFCSGRLWTFRWGGAVSDHWEWTATLGAVPSVAAFGEDARGRLLLVTLDGSIKRLVPSR